MWVVGFALIVNPKQFDQRLLEERFRFAKLCEQERVFQLVERIAPVLAPEFAEGLILDLSEDQALRRIRCNRPGAAALAAVVSRLVDERRTRPALAATIPEQPLTPFYVLAALVLDVADEIRASQPKDARHTSGSTDLPSVD